MTCNTQLLINNWWPSPSPLPGLSLWVCQWHLSTVWFCTSKWEDVSKKVRRNKINPVLMSPPRVPHNQLIQNYIRTNFGYYRSSLVIVVRMRMTFTPVSYTVCTHPQGYWCGGSRKTATNCFQSKVSVNVFPEYTSQGNHDAEQVPIHLNNVWSGQVWVMGHEVVRTWREVRS